MTLLLMLDLFGIVVFAISGALAAGRKQMDLFGVMVLSFVTAMGGGTVRDLVLGATPVLWVAKPVYIWLALAAGLATVILARRLRMPRQLMPLADALGLATFCVIGTERALMLGFGPGVAVVMGVMTAVVGGMIRDLLCGDVPLILRKEIYATAALLGASVTVLFHLADLSTIGTWAGFAAALALRLGALYGNLSLPLFTLGGSSGKEP